MPGTSTSGNFSWKYVLWVSVFSCSFRGTLHLTSWLGFVLWCCKNKSSCFGLKQTTSNQTQAGLLLLLTFVSIPFVPMSISPAHRTLTPVQTGLQMAVVPLSLTWCGTMHCSPACSGNPLWPTPSQRTRKDSVPFCLDPRRLEASVTPLPTNRWGISPFAPTLPWPERRVTVTGRTSEIRSPSQLRSRCGYLLRAREQGRAWDGGVGPGWEGGCSTDPF